MPAIRILSFSHDGGLCHNDAEHNPVTDIVAANRSLLDDLKRKNNLYRKTVVFLGSSRQSKDSDSLIKQRGSAFPTIKKVSEYLGADFNKFLLADVYSDLPSGTSYDRATDSNYTQPHGDWAFDVSKISLLYAQIHKAAIDIKAQQKEAIEPIEFYFFEDRKDIIEGVKKFFKENPHLIPKQVTLKLCHYCGLDHKAQAVRGFFSEASHSMPESIISALSQYSEHAALTPVAEIRGTGYIDKNYIQTVKDIGEQAKNQLLAPVDLAKSTQVVVPINPKLLINRRIDISPEELSLQKQLSIIKDKERTLCLRQHFKAVLAAKDLYKELNELSLKYFRGDIPLSDFKRDANQSIAYARLTLDQHRGWKEFLGNLACFILGLGVGLLIKGCVNLAQNRSFFYVCQTDSSKKLDEVERVVNGMRCTLSRD